MLLATNTVKQNMVVKNEVHNLGILATAILWNYIITKAIL